MYIGVNSCNMSSSSPHRAVPLAVPSQRLHQVLLAAEAEVLDGLGDAAQRAVDLLRVQVLAVVLQHAAALEKRDKLVGTYNHMTAGSAKAKQKV